MTTLCIPWQKCNYKVGSPCRKTRNIQFRPFETFSVGKPLYKNKRNCAFPASRLRVYKVFAGIDVFVLGFEGTLSKGDGNVLPDVTEALKTTSMPFYIVTSGTSEVVSESLKKASIDIPATSPRILVTSSKLEAWSLLSEKPLLQDGTNTVHIVDGDVESLNKIANDSKFSKWQLYCSSWGRKTEEQLNEKVKLASLKDFPELLKWGLLMGVNDGCQEYEDGTPAT